MSDDLFLHITALSEPLRVRLLHVLSHEELGVGELARVLQTPQSTISRHLKVLQQAGWLEKRAEGTASFLRLAEPLPRNGMGIWREVAGQIGAAFAEDVRRIDSVLALREVDSRAFFGRHAQRWSQVRRELFGTGYLLPTLLALLPGDLDIVDLGCGTGEVLAHLAPAARTVVGVDRESAMLQAAAQRVADRTNVRLVQAGLESLPLADASVDAALCMLVLHHVPDPAAALCEAARVLRPGGGLVVLDMIAHDRREYSRTMGHRHLGFAQATLDQLASKAGLQPRRWQRLPPEAEALGPGLFLAVFGRDEPDGRQASAPR